MKIHVCLVSDQILANLIPALMDRPDKVVLVVSTEMSDRKLDTRLKKLLEAERIAVEVHGKAPDTGLSAIREFAFDLSGKLQSSHPGAEITLNATGGTKLMALGFVEFFRGIAARTIYTDTAHRRIETLPDGAKEIPSIPMRDVIDVPLYLKAQGLRYITAASDEDERLKRINERKPTAKYLARSAPKLDKFFGTLNALADQAFAKSDRLISPRQSFDYAPHPKSPWSEALRKISEAGLLGWQEGEAEIVFIDEERTQFLRGGWLEEYAYHILRDEKIHDVRLGVEVGMAGDGNEVAKNEFDVLATQANRLLFIECKTLRFNQNENDNELAYKLDSLGKATRGLFGETWLLSARPPTPLLEKRLGGARIRLIGPDGLPKLRETLQSWMS